MLDNHAHALIGANWDCIADQRLINAGASTTFVQVGQYGFNRSLLGSTESWEPTVYPAARASTVPPKTWSTPWPNQKTCPKFFSGCSPFNQCESCDASCGVGGYCQAVVLPANASRACGPAYCMTCPDPRRNVTVPVEAVVTRSGSVASDGDYAKVLFNDGTGLG